MSPVDVSKEVLAAISHIHALEGYATSELKTLFNDWLIEIERLITAFIHENKRVDSEAVAHHFKLERDSVIFIISKLTREGRISMQASDNEPCRILPLRNKKETDNDVNE